MDRAYYRGGKDLTPRPVIDMEIDSATGLVKPTRGISLNTDPSGLARLGGAYRVKSIPADLEIVQRGRNKNHYLLRPRQPMTEERFRELLQQVELEETSAAS